MKWTAHYKDGTYLEQFYPGKPEALFGDIDQANLKKFVISNGISRISLDMETGVFWLNSSEIQVDGLSHKDVEYRLIYFRRVSVHIGTSTIGADRTVRHFIGFQVTIDGKNHKVMFSEQDGKFQLKTE